MRILYDDRIYIGNIHTTFHDIRTYKYVIFFIDKMKDSFFQFMTFHLSMRVSDTEIRTKFLQQDRHFLQSLNAIVNVKYLSAAFHFIVNRFADKIFIEYL